MAESETIQILDELDKLIDSFNFGKLLREGMEVVIAGRPNVGKSSLMNRLSRKNRSIVTDIPGTTRDIIEEYINIKGIPVKLVDTAGVRGGKTRLKKIGVERTIKALEGADLVIMISDISEPLGQEDQTILSKIKEYNKPYIMVFNKTDLIEEERRLEEIKRENPKALYLSVTEDKGVEGTGGRYCKICDRK